MSRQPRRFDGLTDQERADEFGEYLTELVGQLRSANGWNATAVIREAGVSRTTFYRWLGADIADGMPKAAVVREALGRLGANADHALQILGYSTPQGAGVALPPDAVTIADPGIRSYVVEVIRLLDSGELAPAEEYHIRATLAQLARRPIPDASAPSVPHGRSRRNLSTG